VRILSTPGSPTLPDRSFQSGIKARFSALDAEHKQYVAGAAEKQRAVDDGDLLDVDRIGRRLDREATRVSVCLDNQSPEQLAHALTTIDEKIAADGDLELSIRIGDTIETPVGDPQFKDTKGIKLGDTIENLSGGRMRSRSVISISGSGARRTTKPSNGSAKRRRRGAEFTQVENEPRAGKTYQARTTIATTIAIDRILARSDVVFSDLAAALGEFETEAAAGKGSAKMLVRMLEERASRIRKRKAPQAARKLLSATLKGPPRTAA
jgi:hypothetical protein